MRVEMEIFLFSLTHNKSDKSMDEYLRLWAAFCQLVELYDTQKMQFLLVLVIKLMN